MSIFYLKYFIEHEMHHRICMAWLFMIIDHNFHAMIVVIIYEILVFMDEIFIHTFFMTPITKVLPLVCRRPILVPNINHGFSSLTLVHPHLQERATFYSQELTIFLFNFWTKKTDLAKSVKIKSCVRYQFTSFWAQEYTIFLVHIYVHIRSLKILRNPRPNQVTW